MLHLLFCGLVAGTPLPRALGTPVDTGASRPALDSIPSDTSGPRPRAVTLSDWYYRRLTIHRWGSYLEFPLFAGQYVLGNRLLDNPTVGVRHEHLAVATALGGLFTVNTVTGVWNLLDAWPSAGPHRALVLTHTTLMLGSDAGFAVAGVLGERAVNQFNDRTIHRDVALGSIGLATAGTVIMWLWNR